ncbi:MAG TPA: ABC transporter permease [Candidatus Methylacidiphilales bacterium]|jgi:lipopolysaccharide transport system permease protein|nr:ABC transporter permease [Candidatus Methylacidiphilales bacterium]
MEELIISAEHEEKNYWRDLWSYRELLYFLAWRDILVRYKQTTVGVAWALLRPVLQIVIFTFISRKVAGLAQGPVPTVLLVSAGTLMWQLFASAFTDAGGSLLAGANLISKIYFPRLLLPASTLAVGFVDFLISLAILGVLMIWYQFSFGVTILIAPLFILLALTASLGAGLWIAALTVKYRDFRFIAPFIVQIGFFVSPVWYSSDRVPGFWRLLYSLNPMVGAIDGFRWAIFHGAVPVFWPGVVISAYTSLALLITAIFYFRKTEKSFVDMI